MKVDSDRKTYIEKGKFCLSRQLLPVALHCHGMSHSGYAPR